MDINDMTAREHAHIISMTVAAILGDVEFEVSGICDLDIVDGVPVVEVEWQGYAEHSWEPLDEILINAEELVASYRYLEEDHYWGSSVFRMYRDPQKVMEGRSPMELPHPKILKLHKRMTRIMNKYLF